MGKSQSAPDPYQTAAAQTQSNQQTAAYNAALNRVSQYTPYGNSVFSQTGVDSTGAPIYRNDITLAPEAQAQLDNQLKQNDQLSQIGFGLADQAQASLKNPVTMDGIPGLQYSANGGPISSQIRSGGPLVYNLNTAGVPDLPNSNDYGAQVQQAQDAAYRSQTQYLDPQFKNAQSDLNSQLANQGVVQGSDAWSRAQTQLGNQKQQAYQSAQDAAVAAGNAEQSTLFNQAINANQAGMNNAAVEGNFANNAQNQQYTQNANDATFANTAQQQQFAQNQSNANLNNSTAQTALSLRAYLASLPLNQLSALRTGTQIQNPTFTQAPQSNAAGTDISGDIYKSYQLNQANNNNLMNGLFGLGTAAIMA